VHRQLNKPRLAMFWSSSKSKKKEDDRDKQVKDLKSVFPSIRRPNNDDSLFEIKFVVDNQYSSLRVFIPADFPSTRPGTAVRHVNTLCYYVHPSNDYTLNTIPVLQAAGPVTHPWLDQFKQVNGSEKVDMHSWDWLPVTVATTNPNFYPRAPLNS
jgi:hypothetical protein